MNLSLSVVPGAGPVQAQALDAAGLERLTRAIQRQKRKHQDLRDQLDRLERAAADLKSDNDDRRAAAQERLKLAISGSGDPMIKPPPVKPADGEAPAETSR